MVKWEIQFLPEVYKELKLLKSLNLDKKALRIINMMQDNPYINPPSFEKLNADLRGCYSRRLNQKHRIIYSINKENKIITVSGVFSHYGD